jgi:hypothetical protein
MLTDGNFSCIGGGCNHLWAFRYVTTGCFETMEDIGSWKMALYNDLVFDLSRT